MSIVIDLKDSVVVSTVQNCCESRGRMDCWDFFYIIVSSFWCLMEYPRGTWFF